MNEKKIILGTLCALIHDQKMLFIERVKPPFEGLLSMPGGKIEFGEQIGDAAVREIEEETGLKAVFKRVACILYEIVYENDDALMQFVLFVCQLEADGLLRLKESKEGKLHWIGISQLDTNKERITGSDYEMIKRAILKEQKDLKIYKSIMSKEKDNYVLKSFG